MDLLAAVFPALMSPDENAQTGRGLKRSNINVYALKKFDLKKLPRQEGD